MEKAEFLQKIADIIEVDEKLLGTDQLEHLEDWDSLSVMGLIALVDREFGVTIGAEQIDNSKTLDDICLLLGENIK